MKTELQLLKNTYLYNQKSLNFITCLGIPFRFFTQTQKKNDFLSLKVNEISIVPWMIN